MGGNLMNYKAIHDNPNIIYEKMVEASKIGNFSPELLDFNVTRLLVEDEFTREKRFIVKECDLWRLKHYTLQYDHTSRCLIRVHDITRIHGHTPLELYCCIPENSTQVVSPPCPGLGIA